MENYKRWLALMIIVIAAGTVVVTVINSRTKRIEEERRSAGQPGPVYNTGPLLDGATGIDPDEMPDDPVVLAREGDRYFENSMYDQAIMFYEKALELDPEDVDTYNDLGLSYYYRGRTDEAIASLKKGTEVMPSYQRIWLSLGFVLASSGNESEARPALQRAMELSPGNDVGREAKRLLGLIKP